MSRATLFGTFLGAALLSAACSNEKPPQAGLYPRPQMVAMAPEERSALVSGYALDPEAYLLNLVVCGGAACPLTPLLRDSSPLYLSSIVRTSPVTLFNPATGAPAVAPGSTDVEGTWTLPKVKFGPEAYLPLATGEGARLATGVPSPIPLFPFAAFPPANYVPTLTLRPVVPLNDQCVAIEALHTSDAGVLDAVSRFLTGFAGQPTSVADFTNPERFSGVTIIWNYIPGFGFLRAPAGNTTVDVTVNGAPVNPQQIINVWWAPPGGVPDPVKPLQSPRGFFVNPGQPISNLGIVVILHPPTTPPGTPVVYQPRDPTTDAAQYRPWKYPPITAPVAPGVITAASFQFAFNDAPEGAGLNFPNFCLPPPAPPAAP